MLNSKMRLSLFIKYIAPGLSKKKTKQTIKTKQNPPQKTKNKSTTPVLFYFEGGFNTQ